jgi:hypothetical protein
MRRCEEQFEYISTEDEIRMSGCNAENGGTGHSIIRESAKSPSQLPMHRSAQATQDSVEVS